MNLKEVQQTLSWDKPSPPATAVWRKQICEKVNSRITRQTHRVECEEYCFQFEGECGRSWGLAALFCVIKLYSGRGSCSKAPKGPWLKFLKIPSGCNCVFSVRLWWYEMSRLFFFCNGVLKEHFHLHGRCGSDEVQYLQIWN